MKLEQLARDLTSLAEVNWSSLDTEVFVSTQSDGIVPVLEWKVLKTSGTGRKDVVLICDTLEGQP